MKALIIGHVPPARTESKHSWDETCWQKYTLWMRQYRDVVIGSVYGHMNTDHFMIQDFNDIDKRVAKGYEPANMQSTNIEIEEEPVDVTVSANYLIELREAWSKLPQPPTKKDSETMEALRLIKEISDNARPDWEIEALLQDLDGSVEADQKNDKKHGKKKKKKKHDPADYLDDIGGIFAERFSISFASPSVVPNYFPTIRIYEYNITGLESAKTWAEQVPSDNNLSRSWAEDEFAEDDTAEYEGDITDDDAIDDEEGDIESQKKEKKKNKKKKNKKNKKRRFIVPEPPSSSAPPGPAYSPQALSLVKWTQYFANLTHINGDFALSSVEAQSPGLGVDDLDVQKWKEGKHHGKNPHDGNHEPHPNNFTYEVLYDTRDDDVYKLPDLTVRSCLDLAQRIGSFKAKKSDLLTKDEVGDIMEDDDQEEEVEDSSKDGKKGKKGKKGEKKHDTSKRNRAWYTFVRRALVDTMDQDEIEETFGR